MLDTGWFVLKLSKACVIPNWGTLEEINKLIKVYLDTLKHSSNVRHRLISSEAVKGGLKKILIGRQQRQRQVTLPQSSVVLAQVVLLTCTLQVLLHLYSTWVPK